MRQAMIKMNFESVCSVCLDKKSELFNIFSKSQSLSFNYRDIVKKLSQLEFYDSSLMSKSICTDCRNKCDEFVIFRNVIINSYERQLEVLIPQVKEELLEEIEYPIVKVEFNDSMKYEDFQDSNESVSSKEESDDWVDKRKITRQNPKPFIHSRRDSSKKQSDPKKIRMYKCQTCKRNFLSKLLLTRHEIIHSDLVVQVKSRTKIPNQCIFCNTTFKNKLELMEHIQEHQLKLEESKQIICQQCNKSYSSLKNLKRHIEATHDENKTHMCKTCNKTFAKNQGLIDHLARHKGDTPFICDNCNRSYVNLSKLRDHMKSHSEEMVSFKIKLRRYKMTY